MRVLVCGDRRWTNYQRIYEVLRVLRFATSLSLVTEGRTRGAEKWARHAAEYLGIPVELYPHGLDSKPDLVLAFHARLEHSRDTNKTVSQAIKTGIPVQVLGRN